MGRKPIFLVVSSSAVCGVPGMTTIIGRPQNWAFGHITCQRVIDDPSGDPCLGCQEWVAFEIRMTSRYQPNPKPICLLQNHQCRPCPISRLCPCYDPLADVILTTEAKARRLEACRRK